MFEMNKKIKGSKNLNVPNKGEQSQTCLSYADRAEQSPQGNVPNLRFPEFSGEWEKTTLGKIGETFNGLTGKSGSDFGQGSPYITYKSIFDNSKIDLSRVEYVTITDAERKKQTQNEVQYGDIFFTTSSETPDEVGMTSVLLDEVKDCYLNSFCFGYRLNSITDVLPEYMRFYLRSNTIRRRLFVLAQGSTRFNISKGEVMGLTIKLPGTAEQRKIAQLLTMIEDRIATQIKIIEDLKKLKSAIRAKVFKQLESSCECWSEIGNMLQYEQPSKYLVTSTEYSDSYATPVLTANKAFILGYTDEEFGIYSKGECVIFDDFTMDVKFVNFPFKVKSSAIKILTANSSNDLYFVYEYLQNLGLVSEEHKRHYISEIEPMIVACPTFEEQQNISNLLRSFDSKIEYANRELILYNKQKQHLLSQMFI